MNQCGSKHASGYTCEMGADECVPDYDGHIVWRDGAWIMWEGERGALRMAGGAEVRWKEGQFASPEGITIPSPPPMADDATELEIIVQAAKGMSVVPKLCGHRHDSGLVCAEVEHVSAVFSSHAATLPDGRRAHWTNLMETGDGDLYVDAPDRVIPRPMDWSPNQYADKPKCAQGPGTGARGYWSPDQYVGATVQLSSAPTASRASSAEGEGGAGNRGPERQTRQSVLDADEKSPDEQSERVLANGKVFPIVDKTSDAERVVALSASDALGPNSDLPAKDLQNMTQDLRRGGHFQAPPAKPTKQDDPQQNKTPCWRLVGSGSSTMGPELVELRAWILNAHAAYPEIDGAYLRASVAVLDVSGVCEPHQAEEVARLLAVAANRWRNEIDKDAGVLPSAEKSPVAADVWLTTARFRECVVAARKISVLAEVTAQRLPLGDYQTCISGVRVHLLRAAALAELAGDSKGVEQCEGRTVSTLVAERAWFDAVVRAKARLEAFGANCSEVYL